MNVRRMLVLLLALAPVLAPSPAGADSILLTPTDDRRRIFNFGLDTEFHLQIDGGQDTVLRERGQPPGRAADGV